MAAISSSSSFSQPVLPAGMGSAESVSSGPQSIRNPGDIQRISRAMADNKLSDEDLQNRRETQDFIERKIEASSSSSSSPQVKDLCAKINKRGDLTASIRVDLTASTVVRLENAAKLEISADEWQNKVVQCLNDFSNLFNNYGILPLEEETRKKVAELYNNINEALQAKLSLPMSNADLHAMLWDLGQLAERRRDEIPQEKVKKTREELDETGQRVRIEEFESNYKYASDRPISDRILECHSRYQAISLACRNWSGASLFPEQFNFEHLIKTIDYIFAGSWRGKPTDPQKSELLKLREDLQDLEYEIRVKMPTSSKEKALTVLFTVNIITESGTQTKSMFSAQQFSQFLLALKRRFGEGDLIYSNTHRNLLNDFSCLKDDSKRKAQEEVFDFLRTSKDPVYFLPKKQPLHLNVQAGPTVASHRPSLSTSSPVVTGYTPTTVISPSISVGSRVGLLSHPSPLPVAHYSASKMPTQ